MKIKTLCVAALMITAAAFSAVGKDGPGAAGMAVVPVKGSVFKVVYKGESASRVKLKVYDASSRIVFSETIATADGFIRPLNFSELEFGEYTVEVTDAAGSQVEKISYKPAKKAKAAVVHVGRLDKANDKFIVSVAHDGHDLVTVRIYDGDHNLVHTSAAEVDGDYAQLFRVQQVTGITFEVSNSAGTLKTVKF